MFRTLQRQVLVAGKCAQQFRLLSTGSPALHGTTVLSVRKGNEVVVYADGQVTLGNIVIKANSRKVRRAYKDKVICGFAGTTADALTLYDLLDSKLEEHSGQLVRSCVEVARMWRTEKALRRLEAMMVVADKENTLIITGNGDVVEPSDGVVAIGSGSPYAMAAARALYPIEQLGADEIASRSMQIAADMCIYSNHNFVVERIDTSDA